MSVPRGAVKRLLPATLVVLSVALSVAGFAPRSAEASSKVCSNKHITSFVTRLAKKADIREPYVIEDSSLTKPQYRFATSTIETPRCASKNELYHEFGHHVMARAANGEPSAFIEFSARFSAYKVWLKTSLDPEGFERAAHCVGYQLGGRGAYTRCPFRDARNTASWMIAAAKYFAPYGS